MHICFFTGDISRSGGTERVTTVIANALATCGYHVCILSSANGMTSFFPVHPSIRLHSLHMERHSANLSDWRIWRRLRVFMRMHTIERFIDVDTVHTWYSIPAAWGLPTRVISWEHFHLLINVGDFFQRMRRMLGRRMAVRWAYRVVTLTARDRQQYLDHFSACSTIVAVPNPITIDRSQPADLQSNIVIAVGRLAHQKGFDLLLQSWAQISRSYPSWRLRIVGSGLEDTALQRQASSLGIRDSVDFIANTSDIVSEYKKASIFVSSSRFEGLPLALIEAKSVGLPIISFDCACGPSDIVRDGVDGLLVLSEDINALASALERLITNDVERYAMGRRALSDDRYQLDKILKIWQNILA